MFSHASELVELGAAQHSMHAAQTTSTQTAHGVSLTARFPIHLPLAPVFREHILLCCSRHAHLHLVCLLMGVARSTQFRVTRCIAFDCSIPFPNLLAFYSHTKIACS